MTALRRAALAREHREFAGVLLALAGLLIAGAFAAGAAGDVWIAVGLAVAARGSHWAAAYHRARARRLLDEGP